LQPVHSLPAHPFEYQAPTPDQVELLQRFRSGMKGLYEDILVAVPPSRERALAIQTLEMSSMWLNKAIVFSPAEGAPSP
jgi:hypothetical protein